ncbi:MAG: hypothetical protein OXJ54_09265 [Gemmatimonadetes bacterium]|nr:hypothetical protein [Candidatus Palauibacter rhopaloidicola]
MRKLLLLGLALLPAQVEAQEKPGRMMLEAGLVGGSGDACPGRYVGIKGRLAGPVSLYGMVETYRCADFAGSANRIGTSVRLGRDRWFVRPAVRAGIEYDGGDVSPTAGASLTFGRRYGARFILHLGEASGGTLTLFQMGGYISFSARDDVADGPGPQSRIQSVGATHGWPSRRDCWTGSDPRGRVGWACTSHPSPMPALGIETGGLPTFCQRC